MLKNLAIIYLEKLMRILVASDGSTHSLRAVKYAAKLAGMMQMPKAELTLINVHDDIALRHAKSFVGKVVVEEYLQELSDKETKSARKILDESGCTYDVKSKTGHISEEITALAHAKKYDLIVLGSKGRGAIADILIGSVAQRVLATAKIPVMLVK